MSLDFTVIFSPRQHFGDEPNIFGAVGANFVGPTHDYPFDCPNVDPTQLAVLLFQSYDVNDDGNVFRINDIDVPGGLPVGPKHEPGGSTLANSWVGNVMLVEPVERHRLKPTGNVLHIESKGRDGIDDFILDNMVILFKTAAAPGQIG
jgi:hypothetical protein